MILFRYLYLITFVLSPFWSLRLSINSKHRFLLPKLKESSSSDFSFISDDWFAYGDCQVLLPESKVPKSIIHFVGGFLVGTSPSVTYSDLLKSLASQGHMIVATTIPSFNPKHDQTAIDISKSFRECYINTLTSIVGPEIKNVPIIGLSHSLGNLLLVYSACDAIIANY